MLQIFKRTGSIHKLQIAMGHSNLNVSLTYLKGLEVAELKESDMRLWFRNHRPFFSKIFASKQF